jgi:protein-tyrosine phosphatase
MSPTLYWIDASWPGRLAITARPRGDDWLESEIEGWKRSEVDVVVSLLTTGEVQDLALKNESSLCEAHGIRFLSFPIEDRDVPASQSQAASFLRDLRQILESGRNVAIHCRQSVGRSGLIAAALLIAKGETPEEAIQHISDARGLTVPETAGQRQWIAQFSKAVSSADSGILRISPPA